MWWEHAHNDIVQFPIELGLAGTLLLLAGLGYVAFLLLRAYFWENPLSASIVLGLLALLASSWWDFPFQNPAILMFAAVLFVAAAMWARFEEANARA
jgi:O-antigen ligase